METSDGKLRHKLDVAVKTAIVGSEDDLGGNGSEFVVSNEELLLVLSSSVKDEDGLVDLDRLGSGTLQVRKQLLVDGKKLGEKRDGTEVSLSFLRRLSQCKESNGTENDGTGIDTDVLSLSEFLKCLVEDQLEGGLIGEFGNDEVVVGVEPT